MAETIQQMIQRLISEVEESPYIYGGTLESLETSRKKLESTQSFPYYYTMDTFSCGSEAWPYRLMPDSQGLYLLTLQCYSVPRVELLKAKAKVNVKVLHLTLCFRKGPNGLNAQYANTSHPLKYFDLANRKLCHSIDDLIQDTLQLLKLIPSSPYYSGWVSTYQLIKANKTLLEYAGVESLYEAEIKAALEKIESDKKMASENKMKKEEEKKKKVEEKKGKESEAEKGKSSDKETKTESRAETKTENKETKQPIKSTPELRQERIRLKQVEIEKLRLELKLADGELIQAKQNCEKADRDVHFSTKYIQEFTIDCQNKRRALERLQDSIREEDDLNQLQIAALAEAKKDFLEAKRKIEAECEYVSDNAQIKRNRDAIRKSAEEQVSRLQGAIARLTDELKAAVEAGAVVTPVAAAGAVSIPATPLGGSALAPGVPPGGSALAPAAAKALPLAKETSAAINHEDGGAGLSRMTASQKAVLSRKGKFS